MTQKIEEMNASMDMLLKQAQVVLEGLKALPLEPDSRLDAGRQGFEVLVGILADDWRNFREGRTGKNWTEAGLAALLDWETRKEDHPATWPEAAQIDFLSAMGPPAWEDAGLSSAELRDWVAQEAIYREAATPINWAKTLSKALSDTLPEGTCKQAARRLQDAINDAITQVIYAAVELVPIIWCQMGDHMLEGLVDDALDELDKRDVLAPGQSSEEATVPYSEQLCQAGADVRSEVTV
jgi:hypothetical protein